MTTRNVLIALMLTLGLTVMGCSDNEGPAERAGKQIDEAVEKTGDKIEDATDKAGDEIEELGDKVKESTER
ncbi:MAG TPA: hypothetical protein VFC95_02210 [Guyparkeria sp.]|nr:hypothetical protein [Guyparkeria sp.]